MKLVDTYFTLHTIRILYFTQNLVATPVSSSFSDVTVKVIILTGE